MAALDNKSNAPIEKLLVDPLQVAGWSTPRLRCSKLKKTSDWLLGTARQCGPR